MLIQPAKTVPIHAVTPTDRLVADPKWPWSNPSACSNAWLSLNKVVAPSIEKRFQKSGLESEKGSLRNFHNQWPSHQPDNAAAFLLCNFNAAWGSKFR